MRTAAICPTCATYENAICVIYDSGNLVNSGVANLDPISTAIQKLDAALAPPFGSVAPTDSAVYVGQLYVDTAEPALYYSIGVGAGPDDWVKLGNA